MWLAAVVILLVITVFALGALLIRGAFLRPPAVKSALQKELLAYRTRLKAGSGDPDTKVAVAQAYVRQGKIKAAIEELNQVLEVKPKHWKSLFQLGLIYLDRGKRTKAIAFFKKAAKAKPNDELAYYQLGMIAYLDKDYEEAAYYMEKTVKIRPILGDAHYYLADSYERLGDEASAEAHYEESLRYIPDDAAAEAGLARVRQVKRD